MRSAMTSGRTVGTMLIVLAVVATLAALLLPIHWFDGNRTIAVTRTGWQDDGKGTWKTEYGPITALDRDFVQQARTAALWELPAGRSAKQRGERKAVRAIGDNLVEGHTDLDKRAIKAGRTLGIPLPSQPTIEQQAFLEKIKNVEGDQFDRVFVNKLRKDSGQYLALISLVRDQTRNSMVRALTTRANSVLLRDLAQLEETGLVDYDKISAGE